MRGCSSQISDSTARLMERVRGGLELQARLRSGILFYTTTDPDHPLNLHSKLSAKVELPPM